MNYYDCMKSSHMLNLPTICNRDLILEEFIKSNKKTAYNLADLDLYYVNEGWNGIGDWTTVSHIKNNDNFTIDYNIYTELKKDTHYDMTVKRVVDTNILLYVNQSYLTNSKKYYQHMSQE